MLLHRILNGDPAIADTRPVVDTAGVDNCIVGESDNIVVVDAVSVPRLVRLCNDIDRHDKSRRRSAPIGSDPR